MNSRDRPDLQTLLRRSVLQVRQGRSIGTAFRVAKGLALTCAHVVEESGPIVVKWRGGESSASVHDFLLKDDAYPDKRWPDLALLAVPVDDAPVVLLGEETRLGDPLYAFGYSDLLDSDDSATFLSEGPSPYPPLLKFKIGQVRPGMSGAPLLNLRTGCVVGVLRISRNTEADLGGRATTTATIYEKLGVLESLQAHYHAHNPAWLLALESGQRRELRAAAKGQSEDAMADCVVAGIPSVWALAFPRIAPLGLWRAVGPRGGYTFSVAVDTRDPDRLFVGMRQYGGLYTSHNRGQRFERLDNFPRREKINAIVVAPDDGRILVATNNGLLVSDDSGSTWQLSSPDSEGEDVQSIALAPLDSSIVACGTRKKGGVEFYSETELHGEYNVALNPGFQSGHFHLSLDHGQTWKGLEHQGGIHGIAFSAQHSDKVYLTSADTGLCYCLHGERFRTLEAFPGHSPAYVAVAPLDDDVIVIGGHDGLFASSDGGAVSGCLNPPLFGVDVATFS